MAAGFAEFGAVSGGWGPSLVRTGVATGLDVEGLTRSGRLGAVLVGLGCCAGACGFVRFAVISSSVASAWYQFKHQTTNL